MGRAGCFSFYPGKNLGAYGEGGAITTHDEALAARLRALRDHAQSRRYHHDEVGFNYRMDEIQAAVLRVKLRRLPAWNDQRAKIAEAYGQLLRNAPLKLPIAYEGRTHVWHLYVVQHDERERLKQELEVASIATGLHYPLPVHLQPAYASLGYRAGDFPISERVARRCLSLPMFPGLLGDEQQRIAAVLNSAVMR